MPGPSSAIRETENETNQARARNHRLGIDRLAMPNYSSSSVIGSMITFVSLFIGSVGLLLIIFGGYHWIAPKSRVSAIANQLFATDSHRAEIYLPSEYSWRDGHGLAIWKRRGSKQFAIVKKGSQEGQPSFFEFGMGRLSLVREVDAVDQALRLLLEMRSSEEIAAAEKYKAEEIYQKEQEEIRLEVARAKQLENEKRITACHIEWSGYEARMDQLLLTFRGSDWRPARTHLPIGVTIKEAWGVVSAMIDEFVSGLRHGNIGTEFSDIRTLIIGLVGAVEWATDEPESNEALMWASVFSLLSDIDTGRSTCSVVLNRFAKAEHWDLVHGLSVAWARIEADQLDRSRFSPLVECATGAMVKWWRITNPMDYDRATMPAQLASQLKTNSEPTVALLPPLAGDNKIVRLDEFARFVCR